MHSLKFIVLLISLIVVFAAEDEKEKSEDMIRSGSSYGTAESASKGPSTCDIAAKFLAAYGNNGNPSSQSYSDNYSSGAPNYASQIAALYSVMNAAQSQPGHSAYSKPAGYSASGVKPSSSYAAPGSGSAAGYSSGGSIYSGSGYGSPSSAAKPSSSYSGPSSASGYSSGGSSYSGSGYSSSSSAAKPSSSYSAPSSASGYSSGGSSYSGSGYSSSSSATKPSSSYSGPASASGYSSGGSSYSGSGYGSSSSAVKPSSSYSAPGSGSAAGYSSGSGYSSGKPSSSYSAPAPSSAYSSGGSGASSHGYAAPNSYARYWNAEPQAPAQEIPMNFFTPETFNERSGYSSSASLVKPASYADGAGKPSSGSYSGGVSQKTQYSSPKKSEYAPAAASYTEGKTAYDSLPKDYSRFAQGENIDMENFDAIGYRSSSYGGSSPNYNSENSKVPLPACPKNYLLSCKSTLETVPCVQQPDSYSSAYVM